MYNIIKGQRKSNIFGGIMSNVSDIIEQFILSTIGEDDSMDLSRNELATYFAVAPSQINYVLSTRFTVERGYIVEGKRGGGGYIRLYRIERDRDILRSVYDAVGSALSERQAVHLLSRLLSESEITEREYILLSATVSDKALSIPTGQKDEIRANVLKSIILKLMQSKER